METNCTWRPPRMRSSYTTNVNRSFWGPQCKTDIRNEKVKGVFGVAWLVDDKDCGGDKNVRVQLEHINSTTNDIQNLEKAFSQVIKTLRDEAPQLQHKKTSCATNVCKPTQTVGKEITFEEELHAKAAQMEARCRESLLKKKEVGFCQQTDCTRDKRISDTIKISTNTCNNLQFHHKPATKHFVDACVSTTTPTPVCQDVVRPITCEMIPKYQQRSSVAVNSIGQDCCASSIQFDDNAHFDGTCDASMTQTRLCCHKSRANECIYVTTITLLILFCCLCIYLAVKFYKDRNRNRRRYLF